ncbi:MAG: PAS domain-containing protein [Holophagales bacterium]|nr:PAS domain-containing protein [Holophagales bacterium]
MGRRAPKTLEEENAELRRRLQEAEQTLEAIRTGKVESLVLEGPNGPRIFLFDGAAQSYRLLIEAINEGAATLSDDGTILYCNAAFARLLGEPLERVMGARLEDRVAERFRSSFDGLRRQVDSRVELSVVDASGREIPVLLSTNAFEDDGRRLVCLVATDLRTQRRNEAIVASERFARSVLEQVADALVVCGPDGRIIRASRSAEVLCGRNPFLSSFDEAFPLFLAGESAARGVAARALAGDVLRAVPGWLSRASGETVDLQVSAAPLLGEGGESHGCVVTMVDVSEERRAQAALREADRRKDEFLAMLSHELRNPLAPIRNSLHILERAAPGGEQARRAQGVIDRQVAHVTRLVEDLLDVARISRNKIHLQKQTIDVDEIVARTVEDYRSTFEKSGIALEVTLSERALPVEADPERLAQVVGNLLGNAAKFTGRGGRADLTVEEDAASGEVVIRVRDTGVGMTPETLGQLFSPFTQADRTLERSGGGLGLGLSLVKAIVELHGGTATASSPGPGEGSEFVIRLQLLGPLSTPIPIPGEPPRRVASRVLVIEDNVDAADTLRELLELNGHSVEVAYDGVAGLERVRAFRPEVVLCDIGLPGMSGYEVARAIRCDESLKGIRLVAMSGYAHPVEVARSVAAGFDFHLAKPATLEAIESALILR